MFRIWSKNVKLIKSESNLLRRKSLESGTIESYKIINILSAV